MGCLFTESSWLRGGSSAPMRRLAARMGRFGRKGSDLPPVGLGQPPALLGFDAVERWAGCAYNCYAKVPSSPSAHYDRMTLCFSENPN